MRTIHVIVATGIWNLDHLTYRRHRFAEFLQKQQETEEVIWLCPGQKQTPEVTKLENGIYQWIISDLGNHKVQRFARFIPLFYQKKLRGLSNYLAEKKGSCLVKLWYTYPAFPTLHKIYDWDQIVYDCSDLWAEQLSGKFSLLAYIKQKVILKSEQRIVEKASYITCTSSFLKEELVKRTPEYQKKIYTFENGVEYRLFQKQEESALPLEKEAITIGYIGGIKPKLDFYLLQQIARRRKEWRILLVGPDGTNSSQEFMQLLEEPNIQWTGSVPREQVSEYMHTLDVGIMPYKDIQYNKAIFPLKLFEFLAAGKPVIGMNLPSTKAYAEEGVYELLQGGVEAEQFIQACDKMVNTAGNQEWKKRRKQLAKTKDWETIFQEITHINKETSM
ncbi:teichuronic acid biosynthesis protein TuaH [Niallia sp. FSL W8-0635]|uniref:teichuronic acid biosynthesis protein TuaH n=1 Tax=Niallia sp. FSL W8-0635 TaxID=2975337 RepID=UPI002B04FB07|nr:glycosyltransferase [Yersinia enterocolitica]